MLEYNKRHHLVTIIGEINKDSKQLFKALDSVLGNKNENPLPTGTTDSQLTEDFADFFLNKIDKIGVHQHTSISTKTNKCTKTQEIHTNNPKPTSKNNKSDAN